MDIGIDFGISNIDVAIKMKGEIRFYTFISSDESISDKFHNVINKLDIALPEIKNIAVTGGKSSDLPDVFRSASITKVNEVMAIGHGAKDIYSIHENAFLVVSAGTGTACINYQDSNFHHLGGISVGGGSLQGLANLLINTSDAHEINKKAIKGDRGNVDFLIGDVVNNIGGLDRDITASNFVKARDDKNYNINDIAAALTNMTGEVIGTVAYLNALLVGVTKVYFVGRIPLLKSVRDAIDQRLELAGISSEYKPNMEYANAIGALAYLHGKI